jgi:hypothetical protein
LFDSKEPFPWAAGAGGDEGELAALELPNLAAEACAHAREQVAAAASDGFQAVQAPSANEAKSLGHRALAA